MNNKGQTVLAEYVMVFFAVMAALVAITVFVQRGLEARVHDARNYMIRSVINACDANCVAAAGGGINYEYEPYYEQTLADMQQNTQENTGLTKGSPAATGSIYTKTTNNKTKVISTSNQLPPECAGASPPSYC